MCAPRIPTKFHSTRDLIDLHISCDRRGFRYIAVTTTVASALIVASMLTFEKGPITILGRTLPLFREGSECAHMRCSLLQFLHSIWILSHTRTHERTYLKCIRTERAWSLAAYVRFAEYSFSICSHTYFRQYSWARHRAHDERDGGDT